MRLLLDTHVLLWWLADDPRLSTQAREAIADGTNVVAVSAATAWEVAIKRTTGKLKAPDDLVERLDANGFVDLPITLADALAAGHLPRHHDDLFDRMLIAQAQSHEMTVVTRDRRFERYGINLLPA